MFCRCCGCSGPQEQKDTGPEPSVLDLEQAALRNTDFRRAVWTGAHLQATLMSIPAGGEIGLEVHPDNDQFLRVEQGTGTVKMGAAKDSLTLTASLFPGSAVFVPAGTWHNVVSRGCQAMKLYTIYAPPHHPAGTVHRTQADAQAAENAREAAKTTSPAQAASGPEAQISVSSAAASAVPDDVSPEE